MIKVDFSSHDLSIMIDSYNFAPCHPHAGTRLVEQSLPEILPVAVAEGKETWRIT